MNEKICKLCNKQFNRYIKINGERKNLGNRYCCLECQPFKTSGFYTDKRTWSNKQLEDAIKNSFTWSDVLRKIPLSLTPGNFDTVQKYSKKLNLDISHFTGKAHGKTIPTNKRDLKDILVKDSKYSRSSHLKIRLIKEKYIDNKCSECKLDPIWNNKKLIMVLDHINGIHTDNRIENLRLLCPNCNSQQDTFCGRNKNKKME